jgi:hypothetical protein
MPALIYIYIVIVGSILLAIVLMTARIMAHCNQVGLVTRSP